MKKPKISFDDLLKEYGRLGRARVAYFYARDIIEGRWPPGEEIMMESSDVMNFVHYSAHVVKGRLPDHMHNKLILHWSQDPGWKDYVRKYLDMVKLIEGGIPAEKAWDEAFSLAELETI